MNATQLTSFVFNHAALELQRQSRHYPNADPYEGRAIQWVYILDFGNGMQVTVKDQSKVIWQREDK